ncbi:MAG TPA: M12 family metallo-peptidase [Steroidobacteraceae bacterium]|nr:M12 family metallo-peptidase [Steroidobacteraceae bacterium]
MGGPRAAGGTGASLRLQLQWDEGREELLLLPNPSLGVLAERLAGKAEAFSGTLDGRPGSWAALTRIGERWSGLWFDGTHYFGIEDARSLSRWSAAAARNAPGRAMVFSLADLKLDDASFEDDIRFASAEELAGALAGELADPFQSQAMAAAVLPTRRLSVALLADAELAALDGSQTEANMLARFNIVDTIFASQVGVHLQAGSVTLLGGNGPPPATTDAGSMLDWLRSFRSGSTQQRASGLSHLMTGRDLDGRTVGIAYILGLCSSGFGASLSQSTGSVQLGALITAHEIGHVFGAPHDTDPDAACAATPGGFLMASQISESSVFSACSLEQMAPTLTRACLAPYDAADAAVEAPQNLSIAIGLPADISLGVRSVGRAEVTNARLLVSLPAGGTLVSASGAGAACGISGLNVDCALGSIAPGGLRQVVLRVQYYTAMAGNVQLQVTSDNDALASNDRATLRLEAAAPADLVLTSPSAGVAVVTGEEIPVVLVLENRGPAAVIDARLTVQVPAGLRLLQQTAEGMVCATVTEGLTCGPQPLAAGATARLTLALRADVAGTQVLTAQASASAPDTAGTNNQVQLQYTLSNPPGAGRAAGSGGGGQWSIAALAALAAMSALAALRRQRVAAAK